MKALTSYRNIIGDIRAKKFKPVYILHGEEAYFIDRISKEIEESALEEHERDFNQTVFYGKDSTPEQIIESVKRFPMMAERNLVILREAQGMRIDIMERLAPLFLNPIESSVFVICYKHKKIDGRKKFVQKAKKVGLLFESKELYDNEVPQWIAGFVKQQGRRINPRETQLLADHLGKDLAKIVSEVEKLCVVTAEGETIDSDTIQQQIGISNDHNIFELQNAIGNGNRAKALRIARYFGSAPSTHPLPMTVGTLNRYFTTLALVHTNKHVSSNEWPGILGCGPFFVKGYLDAAKRYPLTRIQDIQKHLRTCDLKSKGIGNDKLSSHRTLLEEFVLRAMT